jgi:hypothetical protein
MFHTQISCPHQYALLFQEGCSAKLTLSETAQLRLSANVDHLDFAQTITGRHPVAPDERHIMRLKDFAHNPIKRLSHGTDKENINGHVND